MFNRKKKLEFQNQNEMKDYISEFDRNQEEIKAAAKAPEVDAVQALEKELIKTKQKALEIREGAYIKKAQYEKAKLDFEAKKQVITEAEAIAAQRAIDALRVQAEAQVIEARRWEAEANKQNKIVSIISREALEVNAKNQAIIDEMTTQAINLARKNIELQEKRKFARTQEINDLVKRNQIRSELEAKDRALLTAEHRITSDQTRRREQELTKVIQLIEDSKKTLE